MRISDWSSDVCSSDLTAMGQQGTAVFRLQAEPPAEQEIAAVKSDVVAALDHGHAVLRILAEHAAHDMHGGQDNRAADVIEVGSVSAIGVGGATCGERMVEYWLISGVAELLITQEH